jgi:membrane protein implicated in regulation of membrane protease activity
MRQGTEAAYVAGVGMVTFLATQHPNHFRPNWWIAALVVCLPAMIAMLPVLYVTGAAAWNITGADNGGVAWPVTATYVGVLVLAAIVNVAVIRWWIRRHGPAPDDLEPVDEKMV